MYSGPSILQPFILRLPWLFDYKTTNFGPKVQFRVLLNLYFKTTCNIRPHFHGPMGGLKIEGPLYTSLWPWYWPWVHNDLQRLAWGKKIRLHSKAVGRRGWRLSEQKRAEGYSRRRRERELGATPSKIGQNTCGQSYGTSRGGHVRDVGIARAEAWLGTWRHVDSRTSTVVQARGVSTTEEREGLWTWRRQRLAAQESPAGCGCTKGSFV